MRLTVSGCSGAGIAQENLRVAILRGGIRNEPAVKAERRSFLGNRQRGSSSLDRGGAQCVAIGNKIGVSGNGKTGSPLAGAAATAERIVNATGRRSSNGRRIIDRDDGTSLGSQQTHGNRCDD